GLMACPLVLISRTYYGTRLAVLRTLTFWPVMSAAGLIVEGLFSAFAGVPATRPRDIVTTRFEWNYTTFLNILFLSVFAALYWLYRNRERLGGGKGYAIDPVCGMPVRPGAAPATAVPAGE